MSLILSCRDLSKSFGARPLFRNISLGVSEGDRVGMIGPNGAGKSTFLKVMAGLESPDTGEVAAMRGARIGYLPQEDRFQEDQSVRETLVSALKGHPGEDYEKDIEADRLLDEMGFTNPDAEVLSLSGGWRKRLAIARELIRKPDLLLMDEPTNHLDVEGILWLEGLLKTAPFACLAVSHDRYFLEAVSTRVVEINGRYPDGNFSAEGAYGDFLLRRAEFFERQAKLEDVLANKARREVEWLRRGPKARTTKAEARISEAHRLIGELEDVRQRNSQTQSVRIDFTSSERRTKRLVVAEGLGKSLGGRALFRNLNLVLSPGIRLGLLGWNGSGKTTLLKTLVGAIEPDAGKIERAERLRAVFFDQKRESLDETQSLKRALTPYGDQVVYRDRAMHVATWARKFLFQAEQLNMTVSELSGGERARILIARLMQQPADLLILDEPTNDLDIPTLEVLEESLMDFPGAVVLVTHDRYMLDRISTHLLALDGRGGAEFFADYAQWEAAQRAGSKSAKPVEKSKAAPAAVIPALKPKKLGFKEQFELDHMEENILKAEETLARAQKDMVSPAVMSDPVKLQDVCKCLKDAQETVDGLYARWEELEGKTK
jgi:ATP-binding cassette subfamily F protein uup